jgi:hypothetical protein
MVKSITGSWTKALVARIEEKLISLLSLGGANQPPANEMFLGRRSSRFRTFRSSAFGGPPAESTFALCAKRVLENKAHRERRIFDLRLSFLRPLIVGAQNVCGSFMLSAAENRPTV